MKLTAYSDRIYARPGETIRFMVNCNGPKSYQADIVRLICGDTNPNGPGYKEKGVRTPISGRYRGRRQAIHAGSFGIVPSSPLLDTLESFAVQAMIWPTTPRKGVQGLIGRWDERAKRGFALIIDERGAVALRLGRGGRAETVSTGRRLQARRWYFVGASFDAATHALRVFQEARDPLPGLADSGERRARAKAGLAPARGTPLIFAALYRGTDAKGRVLAGQHYNGKLDGPRLASRALGPSERAALKDGIPPALSRDVVGAWDFSRDIGGTRLADLSSSGLNGEAVNLPARAMTGGNWTGEVMDWKGAPEQWGAIHFHDDDLYDAGWAVDFALSVPDNLGSGLYAARLRAGGSEEYVPFAIGPRPGAEKKIAFLLPTASYMAYANNHLATEGDSMEVENGCLNLIYPQAAFLQEHPEYGYSPYDLHSDGSGVCYSSRLRPVLNMRPKFESVIGGFAGWGRSSLWQFNADTHLTDWLEAMGHDYDLITDEELNERGRALLDPYRVVVTGSHPEYWSTEMWDALQDYLNRGGRLMYMGGNGFYWRIAYHPELPGVIEVRRNENGIRSWASAPGEYYQSFDGRYGGLWLNSGRPPQKLVGVGFDTQGFDLCSYYRRLPDSFKAKVAFVFKGVGRNEKIGDFGLIGGGAAGLELDRVEPQLGTPPNAYWLASSENHTDTYLLVPEEMLETMPGLGGQENPKVRADLAFFETGNGGAVFSTGSIAWCGSLSHNDYRNNVSRITDNVLRRFANPKKF